MKATKNRKSKPTEDIEPQEELEPANSNNADLQRLNIVNYFKDKCEKSLEQIGNYNDFRSSDVMVDFVFATGKSLFEQPLDKLPLHSLLNRGGKLVGAFPYLGQKSARARAERDVYLSKFKEVEKELFLTLVDKKYKVTEVKAKVSKELEILNDFVMIKEAQKNQWENITEACQAMFSFCQTAVRIKESEQFTSNKFVNNS